MSRHRSESLGSSKCIGSSAEHVYDPRRFTRLSLTDRHAASPPAISGVETREVLDFHVLRIGERIAAAARHFALRLGLILQVELQERGVENGEQGRFIERGRFEL